MPVYRPRRKTPTPWSGYIKPFKITDSVCYVGVYQVCTHLIDTGEGLIIVDAGYADCLYMIVDSIHRMGYDPTDIRYIISTHGHGDHMEANPALRGLTGAKVVLGEKDLPAGEKFGGADIAVKDGDVLSLGNKNIKFIHTPGHTVGCMSFTFEDTVDGRPVLAGTFGGAGANTLTAASAGYYPGCTDDYLRSVEKLEKIPLDVFLANHTWNNDTEGKGRKLLETGVNDFVRPETNDLLPFLAYCRERCLRTVEKDRAAGLIP